MAHAEDVRAQLQRAAESEGMELKVTLNPKP